MCWYILPDAVMVNDTHILPAGTISPSWPRKPHVRKPSTQSRSRLQPFPGDCDTMPASGTIAASSVYSISHNPWASSSFSSSSSSSSFSSSSSSSYSSFPARPPARPPIDCALPRFALRRSLILRSLEVNYVTHDI